MSGPVVVAAPDRVMEVAEIVMAALADVYSADTQYPPDIPCDTVRFFAGDPATPRAAFEPYSAQPGCGGPFLWVRLDRRFRTRVLPNETVDAAPCNLPRAVALEIGVARCSLTDDSPTWENYQAEAELSLEDSWRIECALCVAAKHLGRFGYDTATEAVRPEGPSGGVMAWGATMYVQL